MAGRLSRYSLSAYTPSVKPYGSFGVLLLIRLTALSQPISLKEGPPYLMQETTLKFPSISELWHFKHLSKVAGVKTNLSQRLLTGTFSHADIEVAYIVFNATIVDEVHTPG